MIDLFWLIFDTLLVLALLVIAWVACQASSAKNGVTLFIAFGVLLALAWARLIAPDLALAEAIIGAGIAGVLLLSALKDYSPSTSSIKRSMSLVWAINLMTLALFFLISWALWYGLSVSDGIRLRNLVAANMPQSGVSHPVTAVLLNFRAYDTLLELAVVLTAVLTVLSLNPMRSGFKSAGRLLSGMLAWLVPILIVVAGYLLWVGAHAPGGAFQAGALLAAAIILIHLGNQSRDLSLSLDLQRWSLVIGITVFILIGILTMALNNSFLNYPQKWSGILILLIESAATISIAAALSLAYLGGRPRGWESTESTGNTPVHEEKSQ